MTATSRSARATVVHVLNGPNLNLLGQREPHIYGTTTLAQIEQRCRGLAAELGVELVFRQTNHEGVMVDWIQEAFLAGAAVVINPAGFSFGSIPIVDALKMVRPPLIEVHLSNIHQRDEQHRHSSISQTATGVICGLGPRGYLLALRAVVEALREEAEAPAG